ncbi:uracil-DNA glycosylase [bacterium]|nr:uracil-DNA glycosylase [bacterium]MBU0899649.1 uracil-DNA glycosylase [bacterium]MBU1153765.1 uracil-DNA glycosylase [bacterium]MBU1781792.1 uracil-DNA glycosylase [bacterium]MBU2600396.1 uracil-DNA glycosylase [bacterium]
MSIINKCQKCNYFKITWDKNFPYSCKVLGFKTKKCPYQVVYESSGVECMFFKAKKIKENEEYQNDFSSS